MAANNMKFIVLLAIVATSVPSKICTETTEPVTDATNTESTSIATNSTETECRPPPCNVTDTDGGRRCFLADDPTNCTPPKCVCGFGACLFLCPRRQCPPGATLYRPPYYCTCSTCVCLPKRCAKCDPNNKEIPKFPSCNCPTCQCVDGQCINNSSTTDSTTETTRITYTTSP